jgi:protein ImuB
LAVKDPAAFIARMPVAALEPHPKILGILSRWGVRTVGAFVSLGKDKVLERLGAEALILFERVSPAAARPLRLIVPAEAFSEQMEFEAEIETIEPLLFVLRRFVEQLSRRLGAIYLVASELHLQLDLASGAKYRHALRIPAPTGNVDTLFRMLQTHLENVRTETPIVRLQLDARPARPELHQFGLFETTLRNPNQFAETLARLNALCGTERVGTPVLEGTHRPDAFTLRHSDFEHPQAVRPHCSHGLQLRRFRPAVAAIVQFRDHRPVVVHSPTVKGPVTELRGPFFSSGEWWDEKRWLREEWDIATPDGSLYRIFRSSDGCFVEGVYD